MKASDIHASACVMMCVLNIIADTKRHGSVFDFKSQPVITKRYALAEGCSKVCDVEQIPRCHSNTKLRKSLSLKVLWLYIKCYSRIHKTEYRQKQL